MADRRDPSFEHLPRRDAMVRHAIRRMFKRHGVMLAMPEYTAMVAAISAGQTKHVAITEQGEPVYAVRVRNIDTFAIWNTEHAAIVTFYPTLAWITARGGRVLAEVSA